MVYYGSRLLLVHKETYLLKANSIMIISKFSQGHQTMKSPLPPLCLLWGLFQKIGMSIWPFLKFIGNFIISANSIRL